MVKMLFCTKIEGTRYRKINPTQWWVQASVKGKLRLRGKGT